MIAHPPPFIRLLAALAAVALIALMAAPMTPGWPSHAAAAVRINEFMASNRTTVADEDGDFEDWIELHNTGAQAVDLGGWGLSDSNSNPFKWTFAPGTVIAPNGYLLVWASGKDRPGTITGGLDPDEVDGLVVWLRTDNAGLDSGQPVQQLNDASGSGNHAAQPTPGQRPTLVHDVLNGLPALHLDRASNQQLFLPTTAFNGMDDLTNFTFIAVARWTGGVRSGLFGGFRGSNLANIGSSVFEISDPGGALRLRLPPSIDLVESNAVTLNQWHLLGTSMDGSGGTGARLFRDGTVLGSANAAVGRTLLEDYDRVPVGSSHDDTRTFGGDIAEVLIYNRSLSSAERNAVERHLADKFNLSLDLQTLSPHTNFSIAAAGEPLSLTRPDGTPADHVGPVDLPPDVSYGRSRDDPETWTMLQTATPGAFNDSDPLPDPLAPVQWSHPAGFYSGSFSLQLSHPEPGAVIVYTLDGSEPGIDNLDGTAYQVRNSYNSGPLLPMSYTSETYTGPIPVSDRSGEPNKISFISSTSDGNPGYLPVEPIKKGTVVRARAYLDGAASPVSTATFFISGQQAFDYTLPIVSVCFNEDGLFDYHQGIYVAGVDHVTNSGGRICNWGNFNRRGREAERPGHVQFFEQQQLVLDQGVGLRIHGNCSRRNAFKSLRLHARRDYDTRDTISYRFFDETFPGAVNPDNIDHDRLILRSPNINELAFSRLFQPVYEGVGGRLQPAIQFLNGEYWGICMVRDRLDENHLARHFGVDEDNLVMINIKYGHEVDSSNLREFDVDAGVPEDMEDFQAMRAFIIGNDMADEQHFAQARELLDLDSFIDHLVLKIFAGDDHYAPEYVFWKARQPEGPDFGDGRWRVIVKDFDSTLNTANYVAGLANGTHPRPFGHEVFTSLLANQTFRHAFINRFADLLNAHFLTARFEQVIHDAFNQVAPYWSEVEARWANTNVSNPNRPFTTTHRNNLLNWANQHPGRQRFHLRQHFNLSSNRNLTVDVSSPQHGRVRVNTIEISGDTPGLSDQPYPWNGIYFHDVPVAVTAEPAPGHQLAGWQLNGGGDLVSTDSQLTLAMTSDTEVVAVFEPAPTIHQWTFDSETGFLDPDTTTGGASLVIDPGPATEVLRNTAAQGFDSPHLRVNNPLGATLLFNVPTTSFGAFTLSYDTRRSGQGAGQQQIEYTLDGSQWIDLAVYDVFNADPQPQSFDFSQIEQAWDNDQFAVRITFIEQGGGTAGNHRFDNFTLAGIILPGEGGPPASLSFHPLPVGLQSGDPVPPVVVRVIDDAGLPVTDFNGPVTIALAAGSDGELLGTLTVDAVDGVAVFDDLTLSATGAVRLAASIAGIDPVASAELRVLTLTELILPRFIQGDQNADNDNLDRVPFAWQARIDGLAPHSTYRFANRITVESDDAGNDGAGNMIFITGTGDDDWIRTTSSPRFQPDDLGSRHHTFTADGAGSFTGWFVTEPSGNARFTPGNSVRPRLLLNDGAGGTDAALVLTTSQSATVMRFGSQPDEGTGIVGTSSHGARHIAVLHDDSAGDGRPLAATPVEITGAGTDDRYAAFYHDIVATGPGHWGTILPNALPGGLRRIEIRSATDGALLDERVEPDGVAGTIDPDGGLTPILLDVDGDEAVFLPGGDAGWHEPVNWSTGTVPDGAGASALVNAPTLGNRNIELSQATTIGELRFHQGDTLFRNRLRNADGGGLTFDGGGQPALVRVDGDGGGHVDFDVSSGVNLATNLVLQVNPVDGDPQQGGLRLQQDWSGPGGLIKQGHGLASLTGGDKTFTGPLTIEQGVLRVTGPAVPTQTSGVTVLPGGQLRLVSGGSVEEPRVHHFGGGAISLAGMGRSQDLPEGQQLGILGALRYDPVDNDNLATLVNDLQLTAPTDVHVDGTRNTLVLEGALHGPFDLVKTGGGTIVLAADSPGYTGSFHVVNGPLQVNASFTTNAIVLDDNGVLAGSGSVGTITGSGTVSPGSATLTAVSSASERMRFVLSNATGQPDGNGLLHLTAANPLPSAPARIDLFIGAEQMQPLDRFVGGLRVPAGHNLANALAATDVRLFLTDDEGEIEHLGQTYRAAGPADGLTWTTVSLPDGQGTALEVGPADPPTGFQLWRLQSFPDPDDLNDDAVSGPDAMIAGDLMPNLLRYALDLGPQDPAAPLLPRLTDSTDPTPQLRFRYDPDKSDLAWIVRGSIDLLAWPLVLFDSRHDPPPATDSDGWSLVPGPLPEDGDRLFIVLELLLLEP